MTEKFKTPPQTGMGIARNLFRAISKRGLSAKRQATKRLRRELREEVAGELKVKR